MESSRLPQFYKHSVRERLEILRSIGALSPENSRKLASGANMLTAESADKLVENVIGVFCMPIGIGANFLIDGEDYLVPMVVEEPSVVAAVSAAAKTIRHGGGFRTASTEPILIGQIQVLNVPQPVQAQRSILQKKNEIINLANSIHPNMVARGGGVKDIEVIIHPYVSDIGDMLIVHLMVDTRDAMGANLVNSMCEGVASLIEKITGGKVFLRILSNLCDRSLVYAECTVPVKYLAGNGYSGEDVRDGIIKASEFAAIDPYRAATHNKGIMNGLDAVALATGNDWRAIESAAHAYAARGRGYTSLSKWLKGDNGDLVGKLKMPLKVGTVGGPVQSNLSVSILLSILNISSATRLAEIMGAVGLAQNFAALRALSTEGIQQGHMTLHARTVAIAGGATPDIYDEVLEQLIKSGDIKVWKSKEIVNTIRQRKIPQKAQTSSTQPVLSHELSSAYGKVILLGEHAAVYGSHVIAAPIPIAIQAKVSDEKGDIHLVIPKWGVEKRLCKKINSESIYNALYLILSQLGLNDRGMRIEVYPNIPRAMGLGGSAALAVAIIKALCKHYHLNLSDNEINQLAYRSEQIVHGTPSGIDNMMATFGRFIMYKKDAQPQITPIHLSKPIPIVIGITGIESLTAKMVTRVRNSWANNKDMYDRIFSETDQLTLRAHKAIESHNLNELGELMNINQGLLNALQVSCWELEELISIARNSGALGAKLTGAGGGGAMVALCDTLEKAEKISQAIQTAGYQSLVTQIKPETTNYSNH